MYLNCKNCGAPVGDGLFCPYCGTKYPTEAFHNLLVQEIEIAPVKMDIKKYAIKGMIDGNSLSENSEGTLRLARAAKHCTNELARHILEDKAMEIRVYRNVPEARGDTLFDVLVNVGITKNSFCNANFITRW